MRVAAVENDTVRAFILAFMLALVLALTNVPAIAQDSAANLSRFQPAATADGQRAAIVPFQGRVGDIVLQPPPGDEFDTDPLLQIPTLVRALNPWDEYKKTLDLKHGLQFGISYTSLYQAASNTFTGENDAASGVLEIGGSWTLLGRNTQQPGALGFVFADRHRYGTRLSPSELNAQFGSLWQTALAHEEFDFVPSELWWEQNLVKDRVIVRFGKVDAGGVYDYFKYKNPREGFLSDPFALNNTIAYPGEGPGAILGLTNGTVYLLAGIHDANGDGRSFDLESFFDRSEFFTAVELGYEPILQHGKGSYQMTFWHVDQRNLAKVPGGWGYTVFAEQQFGRVLPFFKYGHAEGGAASLTDMIATGVVFEEMFDRKSDVLGLGFSWGRPTDRSLDNQIGMEAFYRLQLLNELTVTANMQVIFNPASNPTTKDPVTVLGVRLRTAF